MTVIFITVVVAAAAVIAVYNAYFSKTSDDNELFLRNGNGQSYGSAVHTGSQGELPDLIRVLGKYGNVGYIHKEDYLRKTVNDYERYSSALSKNELERTRALYKEKNPDADEMDFYNVCYDVPVYDETGINKIDVFTFVMGTYPY